MYKKLLIGIAITVLLGASIYYLQFHILSGVKTSFAKACYEIRNGMRRNEARGFMSDFENKNKVTFTEKDNVLTYVTPGFSGDFQCYIYINEDGVVKSVTKIFD